jgi:hypothetical protein
MTLIEKLPEMSDEAVQNLLLNARRLGESGNDKQRAASAELLPFVEAEAAKRQADRRVWLAERRAAAGRTRATAKKAATS